MYLTILNEYMHGNKHMFISSSMEDVKIDLINNLKNFDCEYSKDELNFLFKNKHGYLDEQSKSYIEVTIIEIQLGEIFYL